LREIFAGLGDLAVVGLFDHLVERYEEAACRHLFALAAGIESAVIGEGEIRGQIGRAWETAQRCGASRTVLNGLFRQALVVGKRARNETRIGAGVSSIGTAALSVAGDLRDKSLLVVGAGSVATKVSLSARRSSVQRISIANRNKDRAAVLASRVGGTVVNIPEAFERHDVIITATASPQPLLNVGTLRGEKVVIDLGVPSNITGESSDVAVFKLEDVQAFVNKQHSSRLSEVEYVTRIVDEEVRHYLSDVGSRLVVPLVQALHKRASAIREAELERFSSRLASLNDVQRQVVDELASGLVAKLIHDPTVNLKVAAGTPEGERVAQVTQRLFNL